ncbi:MAG: hypothetical protein N2Z85_01245 [Patescibacteria group bacterium]|nr:hypothetical protein [Patescibacteria group bacterium]
MPNIKVLKFDKKKSLKVLIKNSLNSKFFRSIYFFDYQNKKSKDILKNGDLSCAFYVSIILKILGLINNVHTTVNSTILDLEKSGWHKIDKPKFGSVILWDYKKSKNRKNQHMHLGFYLNKNKAVSNSSKLKSPQIHDLYYEQRPIKSFYFHKELE